MAAMLGVPAVIASLVFGSVLPKLGDIDWGSRRPRGSGPIQLQDPTIELNRNLARQSERELLTYETNNRNGTYLRLTSLPVLDANGWKMSALSLQQGTDLVAPPGLKNLTHRQTTTIQIGDFDSQYLPAPYAPEKVTISKGAWGYDKASLTILSTLEKGQSATRNLSYQVVSVDNEPDGASFNQARVARPPDGSLTTAVPKDIPKQILDLTAQITKNLTTPALKAAAIQAYLRDPRNFQYSVQAPPGNGYEVLTNFLLETRSGYCIHFAASMAMMARISGIPSRVSVGFLPGTQVSPGKFQVRGKEMHAWPELYFADYGWVRYEPTSAVGEAPDWSVIAPPTPSTTPTPTPTPATSKSPAASSTVPSSASVSIEPTTDSESGTPQISSRVWTGLAITAGVLFVLLAPMLLRGFIRRRRLGLSGADVHEQVAGLWAELRDTVRDAGMSWPAGSAREKAATVSRALDDEAQAAAERLALAVEKSRYASSAPVVTANLSQDTALVSKELLLKLSGLPAVTARVLPRSFKYSLGEHLRSAWARITKGAGH